MFTISDISSHLQSLNAQPYLSFVPNVPDTNNHHEGSLHKTNMTQQGCKGCADFVKAYKSTERLSLSHHLRHLQSKMAGMNSNIFNSAKSAKTALEPPVLFSQQKNAHLLPQICDIHRACILQDHQILAFLPGPDGDVDESRLETFWRSQCNNTYKQVLLQLDKGKDEVMGFVVLDMPYVETGAFRAWVEKLMVSQSHRRKGVARQLLTYAEKVAEDNHRHLLMLDVPVGTPAEQSRLYEKAGYEEIGVIPSFSVSPKDGSLVDEKFFYKDLRAKQQETDGNVPALL